MKKSKSGASPQQPKNTPAAPARPRLCLESPGWSNLVSRLASFPEMAFLRRWTAAPALLAVLAPAVALAQWIDEFAPQMKEEGDLHVVIAGAAMHDGVDQGIWYQVVPFLLDRPSMNLKVTLLYAATEEYPTSQSHEKLRRDARALDMATEQTVTLGQWMKQGHPDPDLIMLFHPGFENAWPRSPAKKPQYSWLKASELPVAIERGIPIGVSAFEPVEFEYERMLLSAYGIHAAAKTVQSQFVIQSFPHFSYGPPSGWGGLLWQIDPASAFTQPAADHPVLTRLRDSDAIVGQWFDKGTIPDLWAIGRVRTIFRDDIATLVDVTELAHGLAVDDKGLVMLLQAEHTDIPGLYEQMSYASPLDPPQILDAQLLAAYPSDAAFHYERTIWGMEAHKQVMESLAARDPKSGSSRTDGDESAASDYSAQFHVRAKERLDQFRTRLLQWRGASDAQTDNVAAVLEDAIRDANMAVAMEHAPADDELVEVCLAALGRGAVEGELYSLASVMLSRKESAACARQVLEHLAKSSAQARAHLAVALAEKDGADAADGARAREIAEAIHADPALPERARGMACKALASLAFGAPVVNVADVLGWWQKGAALGEASCAYRLGIFWRSGILGKMKATDRLEPHLATRYLRQATLLAYPPAARELFSHLKRHPGCGVAATEWMHWLRTAYERGDDRVEREMKLLYI